MVEARDVYLAKPTPEEIEDVLSQRLKGAVGTTNEDGSVHLAYVIFLHEGGKLYFETASMTRKARNVAARASASMLVDGTAETGTSLMVSVEGPARLVEGQEAHEVNARLRAKYISEDALDAVNLAWAEFDDVAVEITPARTRSWTGRVLHEVTAAAVGADHDSVWIS